MDQQELNGASLDNYSLRGRVCNDMREDMLYGKYKENEELKENAIGTELGVSRTPVREALRQLELEGLVKIIPNKGAYVTGISQKDIQDIYAIRSYLEGLAAKWACDNITDEHLDEMEEITYLAEFHIKKEMWDKIVELDNRFHELIYQASGSKILEHELTAFHHYVERVRRISLAKAERAHNANEEHKRILGAIKAHDKVLAEKLAHDHIIETMQNLYKQGID
ncbi:MAG: GntR family transcriptional regulator [Lachnospiraceae bacterium]|nr:GntR family transcriptional regulator [Lachnospiraceae bacterium]